MMKNTTEKGRHGENLAEEFLIGKGLQIISRNYRHKRAEIDIIAQDGKILVFVEVKLRRNNTFGFPEEAVSERKQQLLMEAAGAYMRQTEYEGEIRFDIIAITLDTAVDIQHFEDAFFGSW